MLPLGSVPPSQHEKVGWGCRPIEAFPWMEHLHIEAAAQQTCFAARISLTGSCPKTPIPAAYSENPGRRSLAPGSHIRQGNGFRSWSALLGLGLGSAIPCLSG